MSDSSADSSKVDSAGTAATPELAVRSARSIPIWLSLLVILVCAGGGVWLVMWYFRTPVAIRQVVGDVQANSQGVANAPANRRGNQGNRSAQQPPRRPEESVRAMGTHNGVTRWVVRSGNAFIEISQPQDKAARFEFKQFAQNLLTPEDREIFILVIRVSADAKVAEYLKMTPQQKSELDAVFGSRLMAMSVSQADRQQIAKVWAVRQAAPESDQARDRLVVALLRQVARRSEAQTRIDWAARVQKARAIFTPEQIEAYKAMK